jgi:hypothetical protein
MMVPGGETASGFASSGSKRPRLDHQVFPEKAWSARFFHFPALSNRFFGKIYLFS